MKEGGRKEVITFITIYDKSTILYTVICLCHGILSESFVKH